jgi:type I restriction-modification system DNA methylase subunit
MIQPLVEPVKKLDYRTLCESLIRTFGMSEPVNWDSSLPAPQQQQLFGGELLRIIADHPTIALQHDIRALCWPKGTVSQLLFLFVRLNDDRLPKSQIERITRRFVGGLEAERYTVWFFGNPSQTMLKVVLAGREGKKAVCKTLTLEAGQWYKTYDFILDTVAKVNAVPAQRDMFAVSEPSLLWKAIWQAFDISIVNKNFYRDIKTAFDSLIAALSNCKGILTRPEQRAQFAVRLLGRLIFCWFLKKKGLDENNALSSTSVTEYANYYQYLLEPLFFDVFNTPEKSRNSDLPASIATLRFLNGGLFEPQPDDCRGKVFLHNDWFTGFFGDTMERYNFTVDENSATNAEIAIDPEMLGRIFENLLAEQNDATRESARNRTGSFYTPREIVDYMVEESLIAYLGAEYTDFVHTAELPEKQKPQAGILLEKLTRMKTIDIATGSGAFPIGMLQKIVMLKQVLSPKASAYDLKLETIENSIYGVDIQPMAIELSRLRCWLSLIVDEEPDNVQPLPNLDFKFVCADSLIDLGYKAFREQCEKRHGLLFLGDFEQKMTELKKIRHGYFDSAHNHGDKQQLKNKFLAIQDEILKLSLDLVKQKLIDMEFTARITGWNPFDDSKAAPFFSPVWMFGIDDGFDICIGNPPYIQIQSFSGQPVQRQWEAQKYATYAKTGDVYCLFYERGYKLLAKNGVLTYITSNKWMRASYGAKLREFFSTQTIPQTLIDFVGYQVFEAAFVDTNILIVVSGIPSESKPILRAVRTEKDFTTQTNLSEYVENNAVPMNGFSSDSWVISNREEYAIRKKIEDVGKPLKDWEIAINYGIKTGLNEAFIISNKKKVELIEQDPNSAKIIKPILRGRDIKSFRNDSADLWLLFIPWHFPCHDDSSISGASTVVEKEFSKAYPAIYNHLLSFKDMLNKRNQAEVGIRYEWYALQRCAATYIDKFSEHKIIYPETTQGPYFYYDDGTFIADKTCFIMTGNSLKFILALLSSNTVTYFYKKNCGGVILGDKGYQYNKHAVEKIPIPPISSAAQLPYECLVDCTLFAQVKGLTSEATTFEWVINVMSMASILSKR